MPNMPGGLSDEKAARMLLALRKGDTLRKFGVRAPRLEAYLEAHPEYAREARPLIEAIVKAALRKGAHIRNKTHCVNGHSFADHGRIAIHKGWVTRQCRACERMRYHRGGIMKVDVSTKITSRINAGASLRSFTSAGGKGYLFSLTRSRGIEENIRSSIGSSLALSKVGRVTNPP